MSSKVAFCLRPTVYSVLLSQLEVLNDSICSFIKTVLHRSLVCGFSATFIFRLMYQTCFHVLCLCVNLCVNYRQLD